MIKTFVLHHLPDTDDLPAAERWFARLHIPEVLRQPGLTRFFRYRVQPPRFAVRGGRPPFLHPRSTFSSDRHRVSYLLYEDARGWKQSVVADPPAYTAPP